MELVTTEIRKVTYELDNHNRDAEATLKDLEEIRDGHADLDTKIGYLEKEIFSLSTGLDHLSPKWELEEKEAILLAKMIKQEEKLKLKAMNQDQKGSLLCNTDAKSLKEEQAKNGFIINPNFMYKEIFEKKTICEGISGYEQEKDGNGLIGEYFDNEGWVGNSIQKIDETIKFTWNSISPTKGVNQHNFSIRWTGFLKAPFTGDYKFHITTNDGAMLNLNNKVLIAHNMSFASPESKKRNDLWFKSEVTKVNPQSHIDYTNSSSKIINLIGGNKYKIVLSYFHSVHSLLNNENKAMIELSWSSSDFAKQTIRKNYLFTSNEFPPLQPYNFSINDAVIAKLNENELAFKDSTKYILADVPTDYQGLTRLKFDSLYVKDSFTFSINTPISVYVGILSHYPNPISDEFENMGTMIALLEISEKAKIIKVILSVNMLFLTFLLLI